MMDEQTDNTPTPAEAAERYASVGWPVVPTHPETRYPKGLPRWQEQATTDLATIRSWWSGPFEGYGVGVRTGEGLLVIDVDVKDGKDGTRSLAETIRTKGEPLPRTVTARTGTGGYHLYFTYPTGRDIRNFQSGPKTTVWPLGPDVDIRAHHGFVVAPPTIHPKTGEPYYWDSDLRGSLDPWVCDVAPAPDWLLDLLDPPEPVGVPDEGEAERPRLRLVEAPPPSNVMPLAPGQVGTEESAAAWIDGNVDWLTLLQGDGWTLHSTHGADTWWTRPGKDRRLGHSAVLHNGDEGPLVVFSSSVHPDLASAGVATADGSGFSLSKFGFVAGTRYRGDRSEAARDARRQLQALEARTSSPGPPDVTTGPQEALPAFLAPPIEVGSGLVDSEYWWDNPEPELKPTILTRLDGQAIIYADQLNWIFGDSGSGKTWLALLAAAQMIDQGLHVLWVHYEDPSPATVFRRLKLLGLDRDAVVERFHYWDPKGEQFNVWGLLDAARATDAAHTFLDSIGESMNASGVNEDSDIEVGPWLVGGPRHLVNEGIGVTVIDHAIKNTKGSNKLHPSGSKRKRAAVTGVAILVEAVRSPTVTSDGMMILTCGKDRHGTFAQGHTIGMAHLDHTLTGSIDLNIHPPPAPGEEVDGQDAGDNEVLSRVVEFVKEHPGPSKSYLATTLQLGKRTVSDAVDYGVRLGVLYVKEDAKAHTVWPSEVQMEPEEDAG